MKPQLLSAFAAGLGGLLFLFWRQVRFEDEVQAVRAAVRAQGAVVSPAAPGPVGESARLPQSAASVPGELAALREELAQAKERIAELQEVANQTAMLLNDTLDDLEAKKAAAPKRSWGSEQATGPPDTMQAGDFPSAWASTAPDAGEEWLQLQYGPPMEAAQVLVRETLNPGAISKVAIVLENGVERLIWQGVQAPATAPADRVFPVPPGVVAAGVKVYLDTARVPGWNEIDAVAVITRDGAQHWAKSAAASSSYGEATPFRGATSSGFDASRLR
ncbi:MAG: hypothetical protein QOE70_2606 [Chthoniobacter sp.]|nr:hypothetical protein [Chthoniobacter sp.]